MSCKLNSLVHLFSHQNLIEELQSLRHITNAMDAKLQDDEESVMALSSVLNR